VIHLIFHGPYLMFQPLQPHTVDAVWARPLSTQLVYLLFHNATISVEVVCVVLHQKLCCWKSNISMSTCSLISRCLVISSIVVTNWDLHDLLCLKPCW
jgi:hypothetical protein